MDDKSAAPDDITSLFNQSATDPSARPAFYRKLLDSRLFILTPPGEPAKEAETLQTGDTILPVQWSFGDMLAIPVFTSENMIIESLRNRADVEPYGCLALPGSSLFEVLTQDTIGIVLNPNCSTSYSKEFTIGEIRNLVSGKIFQSGHTVVAREERQVKIGQPAVYPQQLADMLRQLFAAAPVIEAAYLARIDDPASGVGPHTIIGYQSNGDCQHVIQDAGAIATGLDNHGVVDFIAVGQGGGIDSYFLTETKPFYQKS